MKTTQEERTAYREHIDEWGEIPADDILKLLDDADRCAELEKARDALLLEREDAYQAYASRVVALHPSERRISDLEAALRKVDEIRRDIRDYPAKYPIGSIASALKAPCMEVYNNRGNPCAT